MEDNLPYLQSNPSQATENSSNGYIPLINFPSLLNETIPHSKLVNIAIEKMAPDIKIAISNKEVVRDSSLLYSTPKSIIYNNKIAIDKVISGANSLNTKDSSDFFQTITTASFSEEDSPGFFQTTTPASFSEEDSSGFFQTTTPASFSETINYNVDSTYDTNSEANDYAMDTFSTTTLTSNSYETDSDLYVSPNLEAQISTTLPVIDEGSNEEGLMPSTFDDNQIIDGLGYTTNLSNETLLTTPFPNLIVTTFITKNIPHKDETPTTGIPGEVLNDAIQNVKQNRLLEVPKYEDNLMLNIESSQVPLYEEFTRSNFVAQSILSVPSLNTTVKPIRLQNTITKSDAASETVTSSSNFRKHSLNSSIPLPKTLMRNVDLYEKSTDINYSNNYNEPSSSRSKDKIHIINPFPKNISQNPMTIAGHNANDKIQIDMSSTVILSVSLSCTLALLVFFILSLWLLKRHKHHSKVYLSYELAKPRTHITKPMKPSILPGETILDKVVVHGSEKPRLPLCLEQELHSSPKIIHSKHSVSVESCDSGIDNLAFTDSSSVEGHTRSNIILRQNEMNPKKIRPPPKFNARRKKFLDSAIKVYSSDGSIFPASASLTKCLIPPPPYSPSVRNKDMKFSISLPTISSNKESVNSVSEGIENLTSQSSNS